MKLYRPYFSASERASALIIAMVFMCAMAGTLLAVHSFTNHTGRLTARNAEFLRANAAAEAAVEVVTGRFIQWTTANSGYGPSIGDCATTGVPGDSSFPAIASAITFPSASSLSDYNVSTPTVYPLLADDTVITDPTDPKYLPNVANRALVSENSLNSVTRYYFTQSATLNAKNVPSRSMTYKIMVTVTPKVKTLNSIGSYSITRYVRCDKVSPFSWTTYRNGSANYYGSQTYAGPMYLANNVTFNGPNYTDSVLYGGSAQNTSSSFSGGGYNAQVKQTSLLSLFPNLINNLATDSNGNRQASFETDITSSTSRPADSFSSRELIEPPTNPLNDQTPPVIRDARLYNQADVRIQVSVTTVAGVKTVSKNVVNIDGTPISASAAGNSWVTPLLNAVNVKTDAYSDSTAFVDRSRSTSQAIQSTDINVGALKTVMDANPNIFPTGIIYAWDSTGLAADGSSTAGRPPTGVRIWNAGVLPSTGLVVGSNDPIYLKGDFNSGATLPSNATVNTAPSVNPASNTLASGVASTPAQRAVNGYTMKPAGVFGDTVIELSNAWNDANSKNSSAAANTTINLVEGWSTASANELRADDTYLDPQGKANPIWIEDWSGKRRTMSGEEFVVWHARYVQGIAQGVGGNWTGEISFDGNVTALKVNWGNVNYVRDRENRR